MSAIARPPPAERIVQPPRPPNAWILYRSDKLRQLPPIQPGNPRRAQAEVSKMISSMWRNETDAVRAEYERRADAKKAEHQQMYPGYRFQPMKKEDKERIRTEKRTEKEKERTQSRRPRSRTSPYATSPVPSVLPYDIPLYQPESLYGPVGPSPPMSAASSPEPGSPCIDPLPPLDDSSPLDVRPDEAPGPSSLYNSATGRPPPSEDSATQEVAQRYPCPPGIWPHPHTAPNGSTSHDPSDKTLTHPGQGQKGLSDADLEVLATSLNMQSLPSTSSVEWSTPEALSLQALFAPGHSFVYEVPTFDPALLMAPPEGEVEVTIGQLPEYPPSSGLDAFTAFTDQFFAPFNFDLPEPTPLLGDDDATTSSVTTSAGPSRTLSPVEQNLASLFPNDEDSQDGLGVYGADMMQYLNLEPALSQVGASTCSAAPLHPQSNQSTETTTSPTSYQPPSGACNSTRRAAATWATSSFAVVDDECPLEAGSHRERVSVPAT